MNWTERWVASVASATHPDRNEDAYWIAESGAAAAVIDGMGGYRRRTTNGEIGGEHAAALTATVLAECCHDWTASLALDEAKVRLRDVVRQVNGRIWRDLNHAGAIPESENIEHKAVEEMSVGVALTLIALCDDGRRAVALQHGDTHGYAFKPSLGLIKITEDQDRLLWDRLSGTISEREAAAIAEQIDRFDGTDLGEINDRRALRYLFDKNIFGALGVGPSCPESGWSVIKLDPGDRLALLSDGAYSNMSQDELGPLVAYPNDPAARIIELATQRSRMPRFPNPADPQQPFNVRATQDDMTALVLEVGPVGDGETTTERSLD